MRVIFVLYDSLVRGAMESYGGTHIYTPNFKRFAERAVTFDSHFAGSLPCMPARRELHTGRYNFLHRSWGALEPFDQSFARLLGDTGVYTHLISDHYHYWEDGGATYHNRYSSWEFIRGQEWDRWKAMVVINRETMKQEEDFCCPQTWRAAFDFLDDNRDADNWLLHLECFDPHEPFHAPERFKAMYPSGYSGPILDWPRYKRNEETAQEVTELRANYAALLSMCDDYFGRLLDYMDQHNMWKDTAVVLTTDHGFFLSEHDWWGKNRMPFYNELAHIPLMMYTPEDADLGGQRRTALTQTVDLMPTLLALFGAPAPESAEGHSLVATMRTNEAVRKAAIYGMFGAGTNITDGRYTYFRYPEDMTEHDLFEYTLMPMHMKSFFPLPELRDATLTKAFKFSQGVPLLRVPARRNDAGQPTGHVGQGGGYEDTSTVLFDLEQDYAQQNPFRDATIEKRLLGLLDEAMRVNEAPPEAFIRLGLDAPNKPL